MRNYHFNFFHHFLTFSITKLIICDRASLRFDKPGDCSKIKDVVRAMVVCQSFEEICEVTKMLIYFDDPLHEHDDCRLRLPNATLIKKQERTKSDPKCMTNMKLRCS